MKGIKLYLSMMRRRWLGNSLIALLIAITAVFMLLYPGLIADSEEELEAAYKSIEVTGWMVNLNGYDDPNILPEVYDAVIDTGFLKEYYSYSYYPVYPVDSGIALMCMTDNAFALLDYEYQHAAITDSLLNKFIIYESVSSFMYGVNNLYADSLFTRLNDTIQWLDGYDPSVLETDEMVCIVPENSGAELGDEIEFIMRKLKTESEKSKSADSVGDKARKVVKFKVVGLHALSTDIVDNPGSATYFAYCPLGALRAALQEKEYDFTIRNLSFVANQCDRLDEFKQKLVDIGLNNGVNGVRAAIDDRILIGTVSPIQKNIDLLKGLHLFLYALIVLMGFLLCFLTARSRKQEYAVMRLLGESRLAVTLKAIVEQIILCIIGAGVGLLAMYLLPGKRADWFDWNTIGLISLCYLVGAAAAALMCVRVDVMSILRDKE